MTTSMHRLQISLPEAQVEYLAARGQQEGLSMAELLRRLIQREIVRSEVRPAIQHVALAEKPAAYTSLGSQGPVAVTLDLPGAVYGRLQEHADRMGASLSQIAAEWLTARLAAESGPVLSERARVLRILKAAGMLVELDPELRKRADPTISLEEVRAALDRAGGKPLSEIILEQRGTRG